MKEPINVLLFFFFLIYISLISSSPVETLNLLFKMVDLIKPGQGVLVAWGSGQSPDSIKAIVERLTECVGNEGKVQVENLERLSMCK